MKRDGESRGFGYVDFESQEEADKCYNLENPTCDGRTLRFDAASQRTPGSGRGGGRGGGGFSGGRGRGGFSGGRGGGGGFNRDNETPTKLLLVKNLSYDTGNESLMSKFHGANDARVLKDRETGRPRGLAFVEFDTVEQATAAHKKMSGKEIDGRSVNIVYAVPKEQFQGGGGGGGFSGGRGGGRGRGGGGRGRGGRGGGRGGTPANKGSIQKFEGSKLTFNDSDWGWGDCTFLFYKEI